LISLNVPSVPKHRRVLGDAIRKNRNGASLTQETLAEKAGLSVVFVSLLENGHRTVSVDSLLNIARALKVELKDLVRDVK
jgi:transcriptional regulator with XRE-family HTH domain